jgi:DNA-binding NtrC family response regulator
MRYPQIVVFETDGILARALEPIVRERRWMLRESQQAPACLELLRANGPTVLVQKLGRNLVRELTFLNDAHAAFPDVPIIAVADAEDTTLMALVLELGASHVVQPPQPRSGLLQIVESLMSATIRRLEVEPTLKLRSPEAADAGHQK